MSKLPTVNEEGKVELEKEKRVNLSSSLLKDAQEKVVERTQLEENRLNATHDKQISAAKQNKKEAARQKAQVPIPNIIQFF